MPDHPISSEVSSKQTSFNGLTEHPIDIEPANVKSRESLLSHAPATDRGLYTLRDRSLKDAGEPYSRRLEAGQNPHRQHGERWATNRAIPKRSAGGNRRDDRHDSRTGTEGVKYGDFHRHESTSKQRVIHKSTIPQDDIGWNKLNRRSGLPLPSSSGYHVESSESSRLSHQTRNTQSQGEGERSEQHTRGIDSHRSRSFREYNSRSTNQGSPKTPRTADQRLQQHGQEVQPEGHPGGHRPDRSPAPSPETRIGTPGGAGPSHHAGEGSPPSQQEGRPPRAWRWVRFHGLNRQGRMSFEVTRARPEEIPPNTPIPPTRHPLPHRYQSWQRLSRGFDPFGRRRHVPSRRQVISVLRRADPGRLGLSALELLNLHSATMRTWIPAGAPQPQLTHDSGAISSMSLPGATSQFSSTTESSRATGPLRLRRMESTSTATSRREPLAPLTFQRGGGETHSEGSEPPTQRRRLE